jgi:integrase
VRDGIATIKTEKTDTEVTLPILPVLSETLAGGPCGDLAFIANKFGQPFTKESFGNAFKDACRAAGVPGSAHGLRKIAATRAANAGATVAHSKQSSDGAADAWRRSTRELRIVAVSQRKRCPSSRTVSELLLSHLCIWIVAP